MTQKLKVKDDDAAHEVEKLNVIINNLKEKVKTSEENYQKIVNEYTLHKKTNKENTNETDGIMT